MSVHAGSSATADTVDDALARDGRPLLQIVVGSTRPGRVGLPVAHWVLDKAVSEESFAVELVDLAELGLPLLDEPHHPRLQTYTHRHTVEWSAIVSRADAFVFVTPEYNHSFPASLKNALDFLVVEWGGKPAGIVSYGGVSAGLRAATALKPVLSALRMTVVHDAVSIPFVAKHLSDDGFVTTELLDLAAADMISALSVISPALRTLRERGSAER